MAELIESQRAQYGIPVAVSCRALGVSPAWFYKWRAGDASLRRARRRGLGELIAALFAKHRGTYGSPRIAADLRDLGWAVSVNTVAAIMAERGLVARPKRRRKGSTRPGKAWRAPDLVRRKFHASKLNQRWFGDGTEIATGQGKLHLASVLDICSRRIVGFSVSEHHDTQLAYGALTMAIAVRGGDLSEVVLHTDGGSEYTARAFRAACTRLGVAQSMGRPGSALDNAAIESFHSTLEFELRRLENFATKAQARSRVAEWIEDYNRERRHSALGMRSPINYELTEHAHAGGSVPAANSVPPSSPASRPSPTGDLRPALTPAPGGSSPRSRKRDRRTVTTQEST